MKSKFVRLGVTGAAVVALGIGGATLGAGAAHAATPVTYTSAGANAAAGWYAFSPDQVNFTHIESYIGSSGDSSLGSLPADPSLIGVAAGQSVPSNPTGGVGLALCDRKSGAAAQLGEVNLGNGTLDVVEALGTFGSTALNTGGDVCDNGLLGNAQGSTAIYLKVLLTGVKLDDTVQGGILYDLKDSYTYNHHHAGAGFATFYATDLTTTSTNYDIIDLPSYLGHGVLTDEADAGVVADTTSAEALTSSVPAPNNSATKSSAPNELVRFAHVKVNGNSVVTGGSETEGAFETPVNGAWSDYAVAATQDGQAGSPLYLVGSQFFDDNFYAAGGTGIITPTPAA